MRTTRAKVLDEGEALLFSTEQTTANRLYGGPEQPTYLYTPRMYGTTYGLMVEAPPGDGHSKTLYPWHAVLWAEYTA